MAKLKTTHNLLFLCNDHTIRSFTSTLHLPSFFLGAATSVETSGSLSPSALIAVTRNTYSLSTIRFGTEHRVALGFTSATLPQALRRVSRISTMYLVRGVPPSVSGGFQVSSQESSVTSVMLSGPMGGDGTSGEKKQVIGGSKKRKVTNKIPLKTGS